MIPDTSIGVIAEQGAAKIFDLGIVGVMLIFCVYFIFHMHKSHREERKDWLNELKDENKKRDDEYLRTAERQIQSSDKLADAIAQLSRDIYKGGGGNGN